jgi:hypothetical protein
VGVQVPPSAPLNLKIDIERLIRNVSAFFRLVTNWLLIIPDKVGHHDNYLPEIALIFLLNFNKFISLI